MIECELTKDEDDVALGLVARCLLCHEFNYVAACDGWTDQTLATRIWPAFDYLRSYYGGEPDPDCHSIETLCRALDAGPLVLILGHRVTLPPFDFACAALSLSLSPDERRDRQGFNDAMVAAQFVPSLCGGD